MFKQQQKNSICNNNTELNSNSSAVSVPSCFF